jgi:hypothetical protein
VETVLESGVWDSLCHQLKEATKGNEISPQGLLTATMIVYEIVASNPGKLHSIDIRNMLLTLRGKYYILNIKQFNSNFDIFA